MITENGDNVTMLKSEFTHMINFAYKKGFESASDILNELSRNAGLSEEEQKKLMEMLFKNK